MRGGTSRSNLNHPIFRARVKAVNELAERRARLNDDDYRIYAMVQLGDVIMRMGYTPRGVLALRFVTSDDEDVTKQYSKLEAAELVVSRHQTSSVTLAPRLDVTPAIQKLIEVKTRRALERKVISRQRGRP